MSEQTTVTNPFREAKRYAVLKGWRLHEDGINYVGPPPYHRCMTSEEFDAAIDREINRRTSTNGDGEMSGEQTTNFFPCPEGRERCAVDGVQCECERREEEKIRSERTDRFDVIATNIATGARRILERDKDESNAEAIVRMAVMRRGVDSEFYSVVPAGSVQI